MPPTKRRTVADALSPSKPRKKRPRPRIELVACPICNIRMSTVILDTHLNRCKPRPSSSQTPPSSQASPVRPLSTHRTQASQPPASLQLRLEQQPASQDIRLSQLPVSQNQPPAAQKDGRQVHLLLTRDAAGRPSVQVSNTPCRQCTEATRASFGAVVALRGYEAGSSGSSSTSPSQTQSQPNGTIPTRPPSTQQRPTRTTLHLHACPTATPFPPCVLPPLPEGSPASRLPQSILRSALQKAIRRGLAYPAARLAITLMRKTRSPFDALRRLSIITLEDASLHPAYPELVFLLSASSKGFRATLADLALVARVAHQLAAVRGRDAVAVRGGREEGVAYVGQGLGRDLVGALRVRAAYGGMPGDVGMVRSAARVWEARFCAEAVEWEHVLREMYAAAGDGGLDDDGVERLMQAEDPVLRKGDVPPAAWDFHCCAVADELAREIHSGGVAGVEEVKARFGTGLDSLRNGIEALMWKFRSGVNFKTSWEDLQGAKGVLQGRGNVGGEKKSAGADEVLWMTELEGLVNGWCRNYRRRFGL